MNSIQSSLEKMGSNFLVAGIIPSLAFVMGSMIAFDPILPTAITRRIGLETFDPLGQSGLVALLISTILGFTLSSLNTFLLKVFEGYILLWRIPQFRQAEQKRAQKILVQRARIKKRIDNTAISENPRSLRYLKFLLDMEFKLKSEYEASFPPSLGNILPTRFGNILKSAEIYSGTRYGIDSVRLWPRLIHVIPDSYNSKIDHSHNQLSFLVNCSVLSICFALLCIMAAVYQYYLAQLVTLNHEYFLYFIKLFPNEEIYYQRSGIYILLFLLTLIIAWVFRRASLLLVSQYGNMIRSAYDLFRFNLLEELKFPLPTNSEQEYEDWRKISEFINIGNQDGTLEPFQYVLTKDGKKRSGR